MTPEVLTPITITSLGKRASLRILHMPKFESQNATETDGDPDEEPLESPSILEIEED